MSAAVVTGAGSGIGRAAALALAARGLDVALLGRTPTTLDAVAAEVEAHRVKAIPIVCDVSIGIDVDGAVAAILSAFGAPLVVVNNAGIVHRGSIETTTDDEWDQVMAVNLRGPFLVTRAFLPWMRVAKKGRFVHVGSISSTLGTKDLAAYCASKWGIVGFSKSLAEELRGSGVQSVAVLPGSVDTAMLKGSGFAPAMSPADVAKTIVFAALDAPDAVNGSAIEVFG